MDSGGESGRAEDTPQDSCRAPGSDGKIVEKRWPEFYTGTGS